MISGLHEVAIGVGSDSFSVTEESAIDADIALRPDSPNILVLIGVREEVDLLGDDSPLELPSLDSFDDGITLAVTLGSIPPFASKFKLPPDFKDHQRAMQDDEGKKAIFGIPAYCRPPRSASPDIPDFIGAYGEMNLIQDILPPGLPLSTSFEDEIALAVAQGIVPSFSERGNIPIIRTGA